MKDKISFVSEQANSLFLIGQLVNEIFAYYHFLELVVTVQCVGRIVWPTGRDREHTAIPSSPSEPFNPLPSCISTQHMLYVCIMLSIVD